MLFLFASALVLARAFAVFRVYSQSSGIYRHDTTFDELLPTNVTQWSPADTEVQCGRLCQTENWCNSFFYNHVDRTCALQRMVYKSLLSNQTTSAPGWRYYRLTSAQCPANRDYVIDRLTATCYRLVTSPMLPWLDARAACASSNESLVVLEPVEKARFVHDFLHTSIALHNFSIGIWIGASRPLTAWGTLMSPEGLSFVWLDGRSVNLTATAPFWSEDTKWNNTVRYVVALRRDKDYRWGLVREAKQRFYICERPYI